MTDLAVVRGFLVAEVEGLAPFDALVISPAGKPLQMVELTRSEDGQLEVRVPGRAPIVPPLEVPVRSALRDRGFVNEDASDPTEPWRHPVANAEAAVDLAHRVLVEVFGAKPDLSLDVTHGSHRAEHEARQKLAAVRERVERVLTQMAGRKPEQDQDGDYVLAIGDVHVHDRLKQMFGGATHQEVRADPRREKPTTKPGGGGYL
jgi:hypothetical protein